MSEHRGRGTKRGDDWMSRVPRANVCPCCRGYWRLDGDCRKSRGQLSHSIGWTQTQRQGRFVNDAGWRDEQIVRLVPPRHAGLDGPARATAPGLRLLPTIHVDAISDARGGGRCFHGHGRRQTIDRGHGMDCPKERWMEREGRGVGGPLPRQWYRDGVEHPAMPLAARGFTQCRWWSSLASWSVVGVGRPARLESGILLKREAGCGRGRHA